MEYIENAIGEYDLFYPAAASGVPGATGCRGRILCGYAADRFHVLFCLGGAKVANIKSQRRSYNEELGRPLQPAIRRSIAFPDML